MLEMTLNKEPQSTGDIEYVTRRLMNDKGQLSIWGASLLDAYARVSRFSFFPPAGWKSRKEYMLYGSRIFNKMTQEGQRSSHLLLSARDPFRLHEFPGSFSYDLRSYKEIYLAIQHQNPKLLDDFRTRISEDIHKIAPRIFVANSTIDPINRLWLEAARALGVATACVQHGVYAKEAPDYALEENIVDKYIALDENQAMIVGRNIDPRKISWLGEYSSFEWGPKGRNVIVCFVGEDWERYGYGTLKEIIIKRYLEILMVLRKRGVSRFFYKPHPSEQNYFGIDKEMRKLKHFDIDMPDVYIGFSSSLLKDVSSKGKLAIQILESKTNANDFYKSGYCMSIPNNHNMIDDLMAMIDGRQNVPCIRERRLEDLLC